MRHSKRMAEESVGRFKGSQQESMKHPGLARVGAVISPGHKEKGRHSYWSLVRPAAEKRATHQDCGLKQMYVTTARCQPGRGSWEECRPELTLLLSFKFQPGTSIVWKQPSWRQGSPARRAIDCQVPEPQQRGEQRTADRQGQTENIWCQ